MVSPSRTVTPVLLARNLTKVYLSGPSPARGIEGVSFQVAPGEFVAVMGKVGAGKSTLLHCLAGLDSFSSGSLILDGGEIGSMGQRELTRFRRERIGIVFQTFNLVPTLSARENILLPSKIAKQKVSEARLQEVVNAVGLRVDLERRPAELSRGDQQKVACARAVVAGPKLIVADEPTAELDSSSGIEIVKVLKDLADRFGTTVIVATQDPTIADHADRILVMRSGKLIEDLRAASGTSLELAVEDTPSYRAGEFQVSFAEDDIGLPFETGEVAQIPKPETVELSAKQVEVIDRAQQILDALPGAVAPEMPWAETDPPNGATMKD